MQLFTAQYESAIAQLELAIDGGLQSRTRLAQAAAAVYSYGASSALGANTSQPSDSYGWARAFDGFDAFATNALEAVGARLLTTVAFVAPPDLHAYNNFIAASWRALAPSLPADARPMYQARILWSIRALLSSRSGFSPACKKAQTNVRKGGQQTDLRTA